MERFFLRYIMFNHWKMSFTSNCTSLSTPRANIRIFVQSPKSLNFEASFSPDSVQDKKKEALPVMDLLWASLALLLHFFPNFLGLSDCPQ